MPIPVAKMPSIRSKGCRSRLATVAQLRPAGPPREPLSRLPHCSACTSLAQQASLPWLRTGCEWQCSSRRATAAACRRAGDPCASPATQAALGSPPPLVLDDLYSMSSSGYSSDVRLLSQALTSRSSMLSISAPPLHAQPHPGDPLPHRGTSSLPHMSSSLVSSCVSPSSAVCAGAHR